MEENKNLTAEEIAELIAKAVETNSTSLFEKLSKLPSMKEEEKKEEKKVEKDPFRKLYDGEMTKYVIQKSTNVEGTQNLGGYLVPEEYGQYLPNLNDFGLVRSRARRINMNRDKMNFPYTSTDLIAYNISEGAILTASNYIFGQMQLDTAKYAAITTVSNELLQDSAYPVGGVIMESLVKQFAGAEDALFVTRLAALGTQGGSQVYPAKATGSFSATVAAGSGSFDICSGMVAQLEAINMGYTAGAVFVMSPTVYNTLATVQDTTKRPIIDVTGQVPSIYGYPIVKSNKMGTATATAAGTVVLAFGSFANVYFGDRMSMEIYLAKEGTVGSDSLLEKDLAAFRGISRFDIQIDPKSWITYELV